MKTAFDAYEKWLQKQIDILQKRISRDKALTEEANKPCDIEGNSVEDFIARRQWIKERFSGQLSLENTNRAYKRILDNEHILIELRNILFLHQRRK